MTEIILNFKRKDFEEIFFRDGNEKIFFSPMAKESTRLTLLFGITCLLLLMHSVSTDENWAWSVFALAVFIIQCVKLYPKIAHLLKWRKEIKDYLDVTSKYQSNKIVLTEQTFSLIQDTNETIEHWSNFKTVQIKEDAIFLYGKIDYLLPKKSMEIGDYETLKEYIRKKTNKE